MELADRSALVTGAASGIGLGIARRLIAKGAAVAVVDLELEAAREKAEAISSEGGRAIGIAADVSSSSDVARAFDEASEAYGEVALLFNNAGWANMAPIVDTTEDDWDRAFAVCARGTFLCTREAARRWSAGGVTGAIVNTSSINYDVTSEGICAYAAAKAAVSSFTKTAALELAPHGIRVNAVAPGITRTAMSEGGFLQGRMGEEFIAHTPLGRFAEPEDIARAAVFLASEDAGWITGVTLAVDGGTHMRGLHNYWAVATEG
jgi:3-oxoacyl-[acyl-carrier protein] reductase